MSIFNPELKETPEYDFEANKFSDKIEEKLQRAMNQGREVFADIILCPVQSCGNPLHVKIEERKAHVYCVSCGWETWIQMKSYE